MVSLVSLPEPLGKRCQSREVLLSASVLYRIRFSKLSTICAALEGYAFGSIRDRGVCTSSNATLRELAAGTPFEKMAGSFPEQAYLSARHVFWQNPQEPPEHSIDS